MKTAEQIALWADILRDISANGLTYAENIYDTDRYKALQSLSVEMLAAATGSDVGEIQALVAPVLSKPTPITVADAAIIDPSGRIVLIQRADNRLWAMPGGFLEVGETAAEGAVREALEESGIQSRPVGLTGIYDSRICGSITAHHMYMITVLCEPVSGETKSPSHAHEVIDCRWFAENDVPGELSPGHEIRIPDAYRIWRGEGQPHLDV